MLKQLRPAIVLTLLFTALLGLGYPLVITAVSAALMPAKAGGSMLTKDGTVIGSALVGQNFTSDRYFWPRPSATSPDPYNASASSGSNLGPTSARLRDRTAADVARLRQSGITGDLPADAVMASGSGLDPDISPDYALAQIDRVSKARGLDAVAVKALVERVQEGRLFGFIGEPHVNVLQLNIALDDLKS